MRFIYFYKVLYINNKTMIPDINYNYVCYSYIFKVLYILYILTIKHNKRRKDRLHNFQIDHAVSRIYYYIPFSINSTCEIFNRVSRFSHCRDLIRNNPQYPRRGQRDNDRCRSRISFFLSFLIRKKTNMKHSLRGCRTRILSQNT